MASNRFVVVSTAFDYAGKQYRVGDALADDAQVYVLFPSRFDLQPAYVTGSPGTVLAGGTLGTIITGKLPVTDSGGTVLGYVPIYNGITGS